MCRAAYLWFTPTWNGSTGFSEPSCQFCPSLVPGGFWLGGQPHHLESLDLGRAASLALQMSTLENYTLREIQFILYKVGYLCTVNKYITNLSCLKKVLPFWCLFPKLMLIYKKVLFFVGFVVFSFPVKLYAHHCIWFQNPALKKNQTKQLSTSLLSGVSLQTTATHKRGSGQQLRLLVLGAKVGPNKSIPYPTASLLIFLR